MPLLVHENTHAQQVGNEGRTGKLDFRIGNTAHGQGVYLTGTETAIATEAGDINNPTIRQLLLNNVDIAAWLMAEGRGFYATDADQNDLVTGQTSFADTTPTFSLRVPSGTVAIPILISLGQTGSVAGGDVSVIMEIAKVDRYASSGTSELVRNSRTTGTVTNACSLYSTPTITATGATLPFGYRAWGVTVGADVSPAEGISNELIWTPSGPDFMVGPASMNIFTYAGTTGPTWFWTVKWVEFPIGRFGF